MVVGRHETVFSALQHLYIFLPKFTFRFVADHDLMATKRHLALSASNICTRNSSSSHKCDSFLETASCCPLWGSSCFVDYIFFTRTRHIAIQFCKNNRNGKNVLWYALLCNVMQHEGVFCRNVWVCRSLDVENVRFFSWMGRIACMEWWNHWFLMIFGIIMISST